MRTLRTWWRNPEVIGDPHCPVLLRWMLFQFRGKPVRLNDDSTSTHSNKVMLHRFLPNSHDRDTHDHPWPFLTIVIRGMYENLTECKRCHGTKMVGACNCEIGETPPQNCWSCSGPVSSMACPECSGMGHAVEILRAPRVRYRPAEHAHITRTREQGAWTIVITGSARRVWGFWLDRTWIDWRTYTSQYGSGMVCDDGEVK